MLSNNDTLCVAATLCLIAWTLGAQVADVQIGRRARREPARRWMIRCGEHRSRIYDAVPRPVLGGRLTRQPWGWKEIRARAADGLGSAGAQCLVDRLADLMSGVAQLQACDDLDHADDDQPHADHQCQGHQ